MLDPFDTLGIRPSFSLDLGEVERRYRELAKSLHPDRYAGRPASERRLALSKAIEVNEAWRKLRDPISRAEALLSRAGIGPEQLNHRPDEVFLMDVMEQREELATARQQKDANALTNIVSRTKERESHLLTALAAKLDALDANGSVYAALPLLGELRYVKRLLDEASLAEDELS